MYLRIADIDLVLSGDGIANLTDIFRQYMLTESYESSEDKISVSVEVCEGIQAMNLDEVYGIKNDIEEFGICNDYYVSQDKDCNKSYATLIYNNDFKEATIKIADVENAGGEPLVKRIRIAAGEALISCLPAFNGFCIHASAIQYKGNALLFAAPSGMGKSTHAGLWKKLYPESVEYINDDAPLIRKKDGKFWAYGPPWAGTSGINNNIKAPVKAVVYINRGETNKIRELNGHESILKGLKSVRSQFFPVQRKRQTDMLLAFMLSVPVYELYCDISEEAVELVKSSVL